MLGKLWTFGNKSTIQPRPAHILADGKGAVGIELKSYGFLMQEDDYRDPLQLEFCGSKGQASIQIEFAADRVLFYKVVPILNRITLSLE